MDYSGKASTTHSGAIEMKLTAGAEVTSRQPESLAIQGWTMRQCLTEVMTGSRCNLAIVQSWRDWYYDWKKSNPGSQFECPQKAAFAFDVPLLAERLVKSSVTPGAQRWNEDIFDLMASLRAPSSMLRSMLQQFGRRLRDPMDSADSYHSYRKWLSHLQYLQWIVPQWGWGLTVILFWVWSHEWKLIALDTVKSRSPQCLKNRTSAGACHSEAFDLHHPVSCYVSNMQIFLNNI
jgi:hypothetical protein